MITRQTMTLANSIVGVSVLAMPFCFKQCGIILATTMLVVGAFMTRTVCYFLLKAGTITRRRNYEMLAWHTFGPGGKFIVEISIIGFLIGTLIAFFVVMGDLGPEIVSEIFDVENNSSLRNIIMAALSLFVALPLGLLRNIDSLSSVSTASVLFYVFLVCKVLSEGLGPLFSGSYLDRVDYWRPAGVLQCIPIFSMALSCQTQIFGIYESLPDPSLMKMNEVVKQAVNICTLFYFCVGFFGYIAFSNQSFGGNILMTFSPSGSTQLIKTCFLMSIVFGVPLVIFPCRNSLNSLIFRRAQMHHSLHDVSTNYIPDARLKCLTIGILAFSLVVGILIPNIELVLGLVGSTTGSVICVIFPSIMFIRVTSKKTTERLLAQVLFFTGVVMLIVSTYATLYAAEKAQSKDPIPELNIPSEIPNILKNIDEKMSILSENVKQPEKLDFHAEFNKFKSKSEYKIVSKLTSSTKATEEKVINLIEVEDKEKIKMNDGENIEQEKEVKPNAIPDDSGILNLVNSPPKVVELSQQLNDPSNKSQMQSGIKSKDEGNKLVAGSPHLENKEGSNNDKEVKIPIPDNEQPKPQIQQSNRVENEEAKNDPVGDKNVAAVLLKKLEEHEENQKKFLEEQRQVLAELKEHHAQDIERQKSEDTGAGDNLKQKVLPPNQHNVSDQIGLKKNKPNNAQQKVSEQEIIEKLSENLEKEQENVKLIEKLEEGLSKDVKKDDIQSRNVPERSLKMISNAPDNVPVNVNNQKSTKSSVPVPKMPNIIKPIPVQHSELNQKMKNVLSNLDKEVALEKVEHIQNGKILENNGNRNDASNVKGNAKLQPKPNSDTNSINVAADIGEKIVDPSIKKVDQTLTKKQVDRDI